MAQNTDSKEDIDTMLKELKAKMSKGDDLDGLLQDLIINWTKGSDPGHRSKVHIPEVEEICNKTLIVERIKRAKQNNEVLRVAGAFHSASMQEYSKGGGKPLLLTGDFRNIECEKVEQGTVLICKAGGGCYLGYNPVDPASSPAIWEDSVCYAIQQQGFAFPILGGISQQTVGGFIMTGSAGGSLKFCFTDTIEEIEFVDGMGKIKTAKKNDKDSDLFHAAGVSLGLFGVITSVTFRLQQKSYFVDGIENNVEFEKSFLKDGATLKSAIEGNDYLHLNWFPQKYVKRVMQWTGTQKPPSNECYKPYVHPLSSTFASIGAWMALKIIDVILENVDDPLDECWLKFIGYLLTPFVPVNFQNPREFCDWWYNALPNDNQAPVNTLLKIDFTEIWMPMEKCPDMLDKLNSLFEDQRAVGNFATEIYSAKRSTFWLSMSYGQDMVRVDPYWFHWNCGDKSAFFTRFWNKLLPLSGRLHWGKWLPSPNQNCGGVTFNVEHLKLSYPRLSDWLDLRAQLDPDQVFVTDYWRSILDIPKKSTC